MIPPEVSSFLFGGLLKIVDDIEDIPAYKNLITPLIQEIIKSFIIIFLTHVSSTDVNFPILIFLNHIIFQVLNKDTLDNTFFIAGMISLVLLSAIFFSVETFNALSIIKIMVLYTLFFIVDHKLFPEDISIKKILGRTSEVILFYFVNLYFSDIIPPIYIASVAGYCVLSVINMAFIYFFTKEEDTNEDAPATAEEKEPV